MKIKCKLCSDSFENEISLLLHFESHVTEENGNCLEDNLDSSSDEEGNEDLTNFQTDYERLFAAQANFGVEVESQSSSEEEVEEGRLGDVSRGLSQSPVKVKKKDNRSSESPSLSGTSFISGCCDGEVFATKEEFTAHEDDHEKFKEKYSCDYFPFRCKSCRNHYTTLVKLNAHVAAKGHEAAEVKDSRPYVCPTCNWGFKSPTTLRIHITMHNVKKIGNLKCRFCRSVYSRSDRLVKHVKEAHSQAKGNYQCKDCDEEFRKLRDLNTHVTIVHKFNLPLKAPFACSVCDKGYTTIGRLKKHQASSGHEGDENAEKEINKKPFVCQTCKVGFTRLLHLKNHMKTHDPKPLKCKLCPCSFDQKDRLVNHVKVAHPGSNFFQCRLCQQMFMKVVHLKQHVSAVHKDVIFDPKKDLILMTV